MNCEECRLVLDEYLDGELALNQVAPVEHHLANCSVCSSELDRLRAAQSLFESCRPEIEVSANLWGRVQARLDEEKISRPDGRRTPAWQAALFSAPRVSVPLTLGLVVAAVIVTVLVMSRIKSDEDSSLAAVQVQEVVAPDRSTAEDAKEQLVESPVAKIQPEERPAAKVAEKVRPAGVRRLSERKGPEQLVREAERKYLAAIEILARDIRRKPSKLDPETRTKFDQALASIDRTIDATREAVREHPADPFAAQYMLAAYARKVDVLREIAGAGAF